MSVVIKIVFSSNTELYLQLLFLWASRTADNSINTVMFVFLSCIIKDVFVQSGQAEIQLLQIFDRLLETDTSMFCITNTESCPIICKLS